MWGIIVMSVENKDYRAWIGDADYWYGSGFKTVHVVEENQKSIYTGILDPNGNKIMKQIKIKPGYY